jgi:HD-like signal output (HDOD) protein
MSMSGEVNRLDSNTICEARNFNMSTPASANQELVAGVRMPRSEVYDRLSLLFRRSALLPQLPGSAVHLLNLIKSEDASDPTIERIITSDPALSASIIRIASSAVYSRVKVTTIRSAILMIGQKSIKSLALSLAMQTMTNGVTKNAKFDPLRHSRHSLFTGMLASTLHAEVETTMGNLEWESEELLAVGILHDLHYGVMSRLAPEIYRFTVDHAREKNLSLDGAFEQVFGEPAWPLAVSMFEAWGMPPIFANSLRLLHSDELDDRGVRSFGALKAAHELAQTAGCGVEDWDMVSPPDFEMWPLPPAENLQHLISVVRSEAEAYLQTTLAAAA